MMSWQRATTRVTKNLKMKVRVNLTVGVKMKRKLKLVTAKTKNVATTIAIARCQLLA